MPPGNKCASDARQLPAVATNIVGDNVYRTADLSGAASATLTLWRNNQMTGLNNNDAVALEVSTDGTTWTTLRTWRDISADIGAAYESFDLTPYISAATGSASGSPHED